MNTDENRILTDHERLGVPDDFLSPFMSEDFQEQYGELFYRVLEAYKEATKKAQDDSGVVLDEGQLFELLTNPPCNSFVGGSGVRQYCEHWDIQGHYCFLDPRYTPLSSCNLLSSILELLSSTPRVKDVQEKERERVLNYLRDYVRQWEGKGIEPNFASIWDMIHCVSKESLKQPEAQGEGEG